MDVFDERFNVIIGTYGDWVGLLGAHHIHLYERVKRLGDLYENGVLHDQGIVAVDLVSDEVHFLICHTIDGFYREDELAVLSAKCDVTFVQYRQDDLEQKPLLIAAILPDDRLYEASAICQVLWEYD